MVEAPATEKVGCERVREATLFISRVSFSVWASLRQQKIHGKEGCLNSVLALAASVVTCECVAGQTLL
jgi:hypothetical protein